MDVESEGAVEAGEAWSVLRTQVAVGISRAVVFQAGGVEKGVALGAVEADGWGAAILTVRGAVLNTGYAIAVFKFITL